MAEKSSLNKSQNLILENREKLSISGVEHVDSYNENAIVLFTVKGKITIKGDSLSLNKLNLEDGNVIIDGSINGIIYSEKDTSSSKSGGLLGKMFK